MSLTEEWIKRYKDEAERLSKKGVIDITFDTIDARNLCTLALRGLDAEWRPIAEAPKDGTAVLAWAEGWETPGTAFWYLGRWRDGQTGKCIPTHWKPLGPLPTPPQEA